MPFLGFASGLPLALTSGTLQAWLTTLGLDIRTIGVLSLVGLPYTVKFLWAPLMDRYTGDYQWQTPKDRGPSHLHCAS